MLDPVNAPEISCLLILPQGRERRPYVSYTDRLLDFYNRIVGRIKAELPDKRFTMYAYASYEKPPVKVVPDPSLIVISVAGGDYRSAKDRTSARWPRPSGPARRTSSGCRTNSPPTCGTPSGAIRFPSRPTASVSTTRTFQLRDADGWQNDPQWRGAARLKSFSLSF